MPRLMAPSPIFKASARGQSSRPAAISLVLSTLLPSSAYKDPCNVLGTPRWSRIISLKNCLTIFNPSLFLIPSCHIRRHIHRLWILGCGHLWVTLLLPVISQFRTKGCCAGEKWPELVPSRTHPEAWVTLGSAWHMTSWCSCECS